MALSPIERKAAFAAAAVMNGTSRKGAALSLGYTATHVIGTLMGERPSSRDLREKLADYCGKTYEEFWGPEVVEGAARQEAVA